MLRGQRTTVHTKSARAHPTVAGPAQRADLAEQDIHEAVRCCALTDRGSWKLRASTLPSRRAPSPAMQLLFRATGCPPLTAGCGAASPVHECPLGRSHGG
eukprot:scaffold3425_cov65-Phaeocystis_antarctica.AAC.8